MTLPEQSDRAVQQTRAFLVRLASPYVEGGIKGIRREVRAEAVRLLRHYPFSYQRSDEKRGNDDTEGATAPSRCTLTTAKLECETSVWIPVSERLPESGETVLAWFHGEVQTAWLNHFTNGAAYFVRDTHYNFQPSHWMPLPAPPEVTT